MAYQDCVRIQLLLMYQYNILWLTASSTSLYHCNLLVYSFLCAYQKIGALFHHFDVCGKECLPVNEELAQLAGFWLLSAMEYLPRHSEKLPGGKGESKAKNHYLFMCRSDLMIMFHAIADNFRNLGERRVLISRGRKQDGPEFMRNHPDSTTPGYMPGQETGKSVSHVHGRRHATSKLCLPINWSRGNGSCPSAIEMGTWFASVWRTN